MIERHDTRLDGFTVNFQTREIKVQFTDVFMEDGVLQFDARPDLLVVKQGDFDKMVEEFFGAEQLRMIVGAMRARFNQKREERKVQLGAKR